MLRAYPSLRLVSNDDNGSLVWEGWLQPISTTDELDSLLDDLEHDRNVQIIHGANHGIAHDEACVIPHNEHQLTGQMASPVRLFKVCVQDFGDDRLPRATVLEPEIPEHLKWHMWGEDGVCAFAPWKYPWSAENSSIVDFVDHTLIWLFKWNVYAQTNTWIGSETDHDISFLFKTINPFQQCYCGSGKSYAFCCRIRNGVMLFGKDWIVVDLWLNVHRNNSKRMEVLVNHLKSLFP